MNIHSIESRLLRGASDLSCIKTIDKMSWLNFYKLIKGIGEHIYISSFDILCEARIGCSCVKMDKQSVFSSFPTVFSIISFPFVERGNRFTTAKRKTLVVCINLVFDLAQNFFCLLNVYMCQMGAASK